MNDERNMEQLEDKVIKITFGSSLIIPLIYDALQLPESAIPFPC